MVNLDGLPTNAAVTTTYLRKLMLPCENTRCINYLTVEEIVTELAKRKSFKGAVVRENGHGNFITTTANVDNKTLANALQIAAKIIQNQE